MSDQPPPKPSLPPLPSASTPMPSDRIRTQTGFFSRVRRALVGSPLDVGDRTLAHRLALIPVLAWVGLGSDALSSSAYGPEESFRVIQLHPHLAVLLALATAFTVFLLAGAYAKLVEHFPTGGGYGVATRLLGQRAGLIGGSALLVDYILTITISVAACGDAIFSFLPVSWVSWKLSMEGGVIVSLTLLNLRGVRESITVMTPIFLVFVITHLVMIGGGIIAHAPLAAQTAVELKEHYHSAMSSLGLGGMALLFLHAYSLGGGTYTGIEAVSNALPLMREPRVKTAQRTMLYMAVSLALAAAGLITCYLLWKIKPDPTGAMTMNALLAQQVAHELGLGQWFMVLTMLAAGLLLIVAAQAGFIGGPRVMANMAVDSWLPRRFAALSERLTTENGILCMGAVSLAALIYTHGDVKVIVIMYSINVFITFSLTMIGMTKFWWTRAPDARVRLRRLLLFGSAAVLCSTILAVTVIEKFSEGGWVTLLVTGALVALCLLIRGHYRKVALSLNRLYSQLHDVPGTGKPVGALQPKEATAVVLVASYGGLGIHTLLNAFKLFPGQFKNAVFISVGVVDSGEFKGEDTVDALKTRTEDTLAKYVALAERIGIPAAYRYAIGTDAVDEAERLCLDVAKEFPRALFFSGKIIFQRDHWWQWLLHNDTGYALEKRLHQAGRAMVVLPARVK